MDKACFWACLLKLEKQAGVDKAASDGQSLFLGLLTQTGTKLALTKQPVMDKACLWAYSNWYTAGVDKAASDGQSLFLGLLTQAGTKLALSIILGNPTQPTSLNGDSVMLTKL